MKDTREEMHRQDKEEQMKAFMEIQRKKLEIEEANAKTRAREVELAYISKEVEIMAADMSKSSSKTEIMRDHLLFV